MPSKDKEIRLDRLRRRVRSGNLSFQLSPSDINKLEKIGKVVELLEGHCLLTAGVVPTTVYVLAQGQAELLTIDPKGELQLLRPVINGEILALTESFARVPVDICIRSHGSCRFISVSCEGLIRFLGGEPDLCFQFMSELAAALISQAASASDRKPDLNCDTPHSNE